MKKISLILIVCALLVWSSPTFVLGDVYCDLTGSTLEVNGNLSYYDGLPSTTISQAYLRDPLLIPDPFFVSIFVYDWPSGSALAQAGASEAKSAVSFNISSNLGFYHPSLELDPTYSGLVDGVSATYIVPYFTTNADETVIASVNILGDLNIATEYIGDYVTVQVYGGVQLWNENTNDGDVETWSQIFNIEPGFGGHSFYQTINQTLTSSFSFSSGDVGYLYSYVGVYGASFSIVPAPGAFLLGSLGLGMAGWKLRKRKEL